MHLWSRTSCFILPGKTLFIIYVLVVRLGQKLAVTIQFPSYYVLFSEEPVSFHSLEDAGPLAKLKDQALWALMDSNAHTLIPSHIFLNPERVRTIQTTSPKEVRWKPWSTQARAARYVMDIWSEEEFDDLA